MRKSTNHSIYALLICLLALFTGTTKLNANPGGCWKTISAGKFHTLAIKTDGSLWAWGENFFGELGDGTNINKNTPIQIGTDTNWQTISAGVQYTIAIKTDGSLWAWGFNGYGELGNGTTTQQNSPVQIGTDTDWQSVACWNIFISICTIAQLSITIITPSP